MYIMTCIDILVLISYSVAGHWHFYNSLVLVVDKFMLIKSI